MKKVLLVMVFMFLCVSVSAEAEMLMRVDLIEGLSIRQSIKETRLDEAYAQDARLYGRKDFWYLVNTYNQIHRIHEQGYVWVPISFEAEDVIRKTFRKEQFESIGIRDIKLF